MDLTKGVDLHGNIQTCSFTSECVTCILTHSLLRTYFGGRGGPRIVIWNACVVVDRLHGAHPVTASSTGALLDHRMTLHAIGPWDANGLVPDWPARRICRTKDVYLASARLVTLLHRFFVWSAGLGLNSEASGQQKVARR